MFKQRLHSRLEILGHFRGEVQFGKPSPVADFMVVILGREGEKSKNVVGERQRRAKTWAGSTRSSGTQTVHAERSALGALGSPWQQGLMGGKVISESLNL